MTLDTRTIATILRTADMPDESDMTPMRQGITGAMRATFRSDAGTLDGIVKRSVHGMSVQAEALAYTVSTLTPGLVYCPVTILRQDRYGRTVSVQAFVDGTVPFRSFASTLRSDIVGMAAFDLIIANGDRHALNALVLPTGHHHHDRLVAIDHGAAFGRGVDDRLCVGRMAGLRVPQYIHDHAERIIAGATILRDTARAFGMTDAQATDTLYRAEMMSVTERFPRRY